MGVDLSSHDNYLRRHAFFFFFFFFFFFIISVDVYMQKFESLLHWVIFLLIFIAIHFAAILFCSLDMLCWAICMNICIHSFDHFSHNFATWNKLAIVVVYPYSVDFNNNNNNNNNNNECCKQGKRVDMTGWVKVIHLEFCKKFKFNYSPKWYMHKPEFVQVNEIHKILWDFAIQNDLLILTSRPGDNYKKNREPVEY